MSPYGRCRYRIGLDSLRWPLEFCFNEALECWTIIIYEVRRRVGLSRRASGCEVIIGVMMVLDGGKRSEGMDVGDEVFSGDGDWKVEGVMS
ncbi:unnamed protein product [Dovyalis caffra]|uniref:Uncharacterized protein n=1 Tax=Dovyalis caffra TaxID=77055 RepID=A0AAV1RUJ1_9ROSI|nr:unnamed protein product [Dovyalis caffra]